VPSHPYQHTVASHVYGFRDLKDLMAKATPLRSGDFLAGVAARTAQERAAAQMALAELPLRIFLTEALVPYESDEVTRLIWTPIDAQAFAPVSHLTVGDFRNWLLSDAADTQALTALAPGITPEMAAAVSKLMRNQDLILVAKKCRVVTAFRNTIGLPGRMATRLQPNHPTDDATRHRRQPAGRLAVRQRGRGDRHQPRDRQRGPGDEAGAHDGRRHRALRHPDAELCAHPCDQYHPGD